MLNIAGNEIADALAKLAAKEATEMNTESDITTKSDIRSAVKKSTKEKWQFRWDNSETGRQLYNLQEKVGQPSILDWPNQHTGQIITELRTGYSRLNKYKHQVGISKTSKCDCGAEESTDHYLLNCERYEAQRMTLQRNIRAISPCFIMDTQTLLSKTESNKSHYRDILQLVGDFIDNTGRFNISSQQTKT